MAVQVGSRTTYDSTVGVRLDVQDAIFMISPFDVPFLGSYGMDRGSILGSDETTSTKVEWIEDELVPGSDALAATAITADTYITVDNRTYFKTNDLIRIDDEYMRVTQYGTTAATLEVERSWGTPAAGQHSDNATVLILGTLPAEGSDPTSGINFQRTSPYNYTQIFQDEVEVTRSEEKEAKYGVSSEKAYQMAKRMKENAIKFERNIILGTRNQDSSGERRSFGGLDFFITTGVDSTTTVITETLLVNQLQNAFDRGGSVDILAVGGTQKRTISAFSNTLVQLTRDDQVRGSIVEWIDSDFGRIYMVLNRWVPTRFAFGLEKQFIDVVWFDRWFAEDLAKTGDRRQSQLVCEATMRIKNEKAHFKFNALT